jgi:hypothetical protein
MNIGKKSRIDRKILGTIWYRYVANMQEKTYRRPVRLGQPWVASSQLGQCRPGQDQPQPATNQPMPGCDQSWLGHSRLGWPWPVGSRPRRAGRRPAPLATARPHHDRCPASPAPGRPLGPAGHQAGYPAPRATARRPMLADWPSCARHCTGVATPSRGRAPDQRHHLRPCRLVPSRRPTLSLAPIKGASLLSSLPQPSCQVPFSS